MVVTAQRVETHDLDSPASIEVYDEERIEKTGAANVFDVLQNTLGVTSHSQGFNGTSMGTMNSKIAIRGVEKGTLILVNGVPMNQDGKYYLGDIPTESIERIEVVRGGGSVLYGSEATGGVINIITKKKFNNSVGVAAGNFGKERYKVSVGADKFNLIAGLENRGFASPMAGISTTGGTNAYRDYLKGERKSILWNYELTDGLVFTHSYVKNRDAYRQVNVFTNSPIQSPEYRNTNNNFLLRYDKGDWKATASYGIQEKETEQTTYATGVKTRTAWRKGHRTYLDVQKQFKLGKNKILVGVDFDRNNMNTFSNSTTFINTSRVPVDSSMKRDVISIYASYDWAMGDKSHLMINARETFSQGHKGDQVNRRNGAVNHMEGDKISNFSPEIEYNYRINENSSFYAKAGKSFNLPTLTQIFNNGIGNMSLGLNPEKGTHFELGYKLNQNKNAWRVSIFNYEIKDAIESVVLEPGNVNYINSDIRNTGIEVSVNMKHNDNWSTNWGVMYNRPQARDFSHYDDYDWHDYYGRYQLIGGVKYNNKKFSASLDANFVGNRTRQNNAQPAHVKPQLFTNLHLTYQPKTNHKFYFHLNNILDRRDITSNSSSNFYSLGCNYMVGYEITF